MTADLVACAHGTADPRGRRVVHDLVRRIAESRASVPVSLGFVDVDLPAFSSVVSRVVADSNEVIVVPLFLSSGYHVRVDIRRDRASAVVAPALGPHPLLVDVLVDRLGDALGSADRVVLAAAGSSDPRALRDCESTAGLLAGRIGLSVEVGYLSGRGRRLREVLDGGRGRGRVAVASYLLAPGFFADRVARISAAAGVCCSAPLGADPRIALLALLRYDETVRRSQVLSAVDGQNALSTRESIGSVTVGAMH